MKIGQQFSWVTGAWQGIVKFAAAAEGATVAQTIAAAATRAWGLAMDALPWVALAAAVVAVADPDHQVPPADLGRSSSGCGTTSSP